MFTVSALLLTASRSGASKQTEQTMTVLHAALATGNRASADQIVDIRKEELLSALPLLNRWLLKLEMAPRLRTLLYQADLKWTAGGLIMMSVACFANSCLSHLSADRSGHFFSLDRDVAWRSARLSTCFRNEDNASTNLSRVCPRHSI